MYLSIATGQSPVLKCVTAQAASVAVDGGMTSERQQMMDEALLEPRQIAAAVIHADNASPRLVVQVGAFQGEFLEVLLDEFPAARGQWTEAITSKHNLPDTRVRFARFGDRVDF
jgi:hypothetical protein